MAELEVVARERGIPSLVLQTGNRQREAITLYEKIGYERIGPFGLYPDVPFFLFYGKQLDPKTP
jgi:ribosomal protein S18 acetylase RimI-like enzyme